MKAHEIVVKVDMSQIEPILEKLYARITDLQNENAKLKDALEEAHDDLDEAQERITDLEGLPLHS
jgi:peptidoglycan hydrolase CwlO-like protein